MFLKKRNAGDTNPPSDPIGENSIDNHGNDNDQLYEIECCDPSDEGPDEILLSSDEESDDESFSFV